MSGSRLCEHLGRMAKVMIELATLGWLLRVARLGVVNCLAPSVMTYVCGKDGSHIRVSQCMVCQWFAMSIFSLLRRLHCNLILALLAIARIAGIDWNAIGIEWFVFESELSKIIFVPLVPGVTCKRGDGTEISERGHCEIRPVYREAFADCGISCDFAKRAL